MARTAYVIVFDRASLLTGEIKELRIDGFVDVQAARQTFTTVRLQYEERGFRLDHPRIVGPDGAVYAVEEG